MARKRDKRRSNGQRKRRISEMIWEFAGDFIRMSETVEQRQSFLNVEVFRLPEERIRNRL